jgi:hypothetical protein
MIRFRVSIASLMTLLVAGCATPERQVSDLSAPAAPRLTWQPSRQPQPVVHAPAARDLVIREHRFVTHSPQLNSDGEEQVLRLASCLRDSSAKIMIEPSNGTAVVPVNSSSLSSKLLKLDLERRQYVVQKLLTLGIPDAESRVVLQASTEA